MTQRDAEAQLSLLIENALRLAAADESLPVIAGRLYDSEREIYTCLRRPWAIERTVRMMKLRQRRQVPAKQLPIPGFEELPRRIAVDEKQRPKPGTPAAAPGGKVWLREATLSQLIAYRKHLSKIRDHRIAKLDELI